MDSRNGMVAHEMTYGRFDLHPGDDRYPQALLELPSPPEVLHGIGDAALLHEQCLGVIGARRATPYGMAAAEMAGRIAAASNVVVVSGGAMGCDSCAEYAAINRGGKTIVVAGTGANVPYPKTSKELFERAWAGEGVVVSLCPWDQEARPFAFRRRNDVIAALSHALMVVEAGVPSGTISTANMALELGRIIYAVPGSIFSPQSRGTNSLIEQGAGIIVDEVGLEERVALDFGRLRSIEQRDDLVLSRVLEAVVASPSRVDELACRLDSEPIGLARELSEYEMLGLVKRLPDGRYAASEKLLLRKMDSEHDGNESPPRRFVV